MALCQAFAKTRISIFVAVVLQSQLLFLLPVLSVFTVTQFLSSSFPYVLFLSSVTAENADVSRHITFSSCHLCLRH